LTPAATAATVGRRSISAPHQEDDAVFVRARYLVAAALGLCAAHLLPAQEPGPLGLESAAPRSANQQLADAVATQLRQGGRLQRYSIDIVCREGLVEVTGMVADPAQREEALRIVQGVPGVERVLDRLTLSAGGPVEQAQAGTPPAPLRGSLRQGQEVTPPRPTNGTGNGTGTGPAPEPVPIMGGHGHGPYDLNPPKMPPYAWPTYAPYNNFSRVAYPLAYPYNAWPFIGPVHPFPKVPLGWRSVKLEWQDGHWWYGRTATKYDWWRLRYW
jgi:hypothetical protein